MNSAPEEIASLRSRFLLKVIKALPRLIVSAVLPYLLYEALRPHVSSDTVALAIVSAFPAAWVLVSAAWRRKVELFPLVSLLGFGFALISSVLTGGSALALKITDPVLVGLVGLVLLGSIAAGRPLLEPVYRAMARKNPNMGVASKRVAAVSTAIIGVTVLVRSGLIIVCAFALPTGGFIIAKNVIDIPSLVLGLGVLVWYRFRVYAASLAAGADRPGPVAAPGEQPRSAIGVDQQGPATLPASEEEFCGSR
jgi:hypothetical protein